MSLTLVMSGGGVNFALKSEVARQGMGGVTCCELLQDPALLLQHHNSKRQAQLERRGTSQDGVHPQLRKRIGPGHT